MSLDTERSRATPEGVTLALRVAGPPVRALAWGIDLGVLVAIQLFVTMLTGWMGAAGVGLQFFAFFATSWFYPVAFEVWRNGSTPGKASFGLQVIHADGTPVGLGASLLRNLLRFADFLPVAYGAGLIAMLVSPDFQRLGDLAAGTVVVYREGQPKEWRLPPAPPVAPPFVLGPEEQRAVIDFAARLDGWTEGRQVELADVATPLTGRSGTSGVERLVGMANWLLGRRDAVSVREPLR